MTSYHFAVVLGTILSALGIWLLLPRDARRRHARTGGALLIAAGLGLEAWQIPSLGRWIADGAILFYVLSAATIAAAIAAVVARSPIRSVLGFGALLLAAAGMLIFAGTGLPAVAAVVICAAAIPLSFLFKLRTRKETGLRIPRGTVPFSLRENRESPQREDRDSWEPMTSAAVGMAIVGVLFISAQGALETAASDGPFAAQMHDAGLSLRREIALLQGYLGVGAWLFGLGMVGLLSRHGIVARSLSLSTMLWGVVLSLAGWDRIHGHSGGRAFGIGIMVLAACQTGLVLALSAGPKTEVPGHPSQDTTSRFHGLAMALGLLALIAALLAT